MLGPIQFVEQSNIAGNSKFLDNFISPHNFGKSRMDRLIVVFLLCSSL